MKKIINIETGETTTEELTAEEVAENETSTTKFQEELNASAKRATDRASAKAKLIAGEALTEEEADTIVL